MLDCDGLGQATLGKARLGQVKLGGDRFGKVTLKNFNFGCPASNFYAF